MKNILHKILIILAVLVGAALIYTAVFALTTIGTNVSTDGNLSIGGNSALNTVVSGTWNGSAIGSTYGGTGLTAYTTGDILYASGVDALSKLSIGTAGQVLTVTGGLPAWETLSASPVTSVFGRTGDVVAASNDYTWEQIDKTTSSLADIATRNIGDTTGTLAEARGGTNQTTYSTGDILYASGADTLSKLSAGADGQVLTLASGVPSWATLVGGGTSVTVQDTSTTAIGTTDTTLLTAPAITASGQPVLIIASIQLDNTSASITNSTYKLYRDETLLESYGERLASADDNVTRTFHFYDTPGTGSFTYSIRATAETDGVIRRIANSRLTVFTVSD